MRGREGLAEDAGIVAVDGFVCHGGQAVVSRVVARHGDLVAEFLGLGLFGDEGDLALIDNGIEIVHDHVVQHLAEVAQAQALFIGVVGNTHANLIALAGVHDAFHIVEPGVDLTLDDGLEVRLHLRTGSLNIGHKRKVLFAAVQVLADDGDLMILDVVGHGDQLGRGVLAGPELVVHIRLTDDLALEGSGKGHRDGQLLGLDLDVAQLKGALDGQVMVADGLQRTGHLILAQINVHDDREAQSNRARARGNDHVVDGAEGVDKGGNSRLGVGQQSCQIAGLHIAEDQRRTDGDGDDMDDTRHVVTQRDDTELQTHLHTAFGALLDDIADHKGHDALGLVVLDNLDDVLGIFRLAQHDRHAGNIARDQRHAQRTDDGVGNKSDAGIGSVGIAALDILQALENFCADGGSKAGIERLRQILLIGDQALHDAHTGGQITQLRDLHARGGIDRREEIRSVRERECFVCAVFGNCIIDRAFGQAGDGIRTAIDKIG